MTPFLAACGTGDIEIVKLLLEHGANPKLATSDGRGPIIMAVSGNRSRNPFAFPGRARGGAARGAGAAEGDEAADEGEGTAAGKQQDNPQVQLIQSARRCRRGLEVGGQDPSAGSARAAAQRCTTRYATAVIARSSRKLLDLGIDVNVKDADGLTALDYAMGRGYVPFLRWPSHPNKPLADFLRSKGANIELAKTPDWPPQGPPIATAVYDSFIWPVDPVGP